MSVQCLLIGSEHFLKCFMWINLMHRMFYQM